MPNAEVLLQRIDELLSIRITREESTGKKAGEAYSGAIGIASKLYGENSQQLVAIKEIYKRIMNIKVSEFNRHRLLVDEIKGLLKNFKREIESGLIYSIQMEAKGEILADFILLAKDALNEESKDVAAVLACAALEDTLKRYAESNDLDVQDKNMSEVIGALKSISLLRGPESKIVQSFVALRNKAFHAQWEKIELSAVNSVSAFVEQFILNKF